MVAASSLQFLEIQGEEITDKGRFCSGSVLSGDFFSFSFSTKTVFFSGVVLSQRTSAMPLRCEVDSLESLALSRVGDVVTKVGKLLCICRCL